MKPLISIVFGTRPEAIKLAPVIKKFKESNKFRTRVILTGQHKEMVSQVMNIFNLTEDLNLNLMKPNQSLTHITCATLEGLRNDFQKNRPDMALVQGDTSTAFASALAAFYEEIPIGHVEAGLRTDDLKNPFPEEANRRLISQIASLHFAPTEKAVQNLKNCSVVGDIHNTGNTVIDALIHTALYVNKDPINIKGIDWENQDVILTTIHRRENWKYLDDIANGLLRILDKNKKASMILPLHKNPIVREPLKKIFEDNPRVSLIEPLGYGDLVSVMRYSKLILTDSGGIQEEAPSLGKPVLVLREATERQESIDAGVSILVGRDSDKIFAEADRLLNNSVDYFTMTLKDNPYGDGKSSCSIFKHCVDFLGA